MRAPHGGAALLFENDEVTEYWMTKWTEHDGKPAHAKVGDSGSQTCWELATLVLVVVHWTPLNEGLVICGDNSGSLQLSVGMASAKNERTLLRELAWRKARGGWEFDVCHIPSGSNTTTDVLSRFFETPEDQRIMPDT